MLWGAEKLEDMILALKNDTLFLDSEVYSMLGHLKMRLKDGFRDSIFPLKLCAKFLSTCIFSGKNVKGFTSGIQRDSFPKKYQTTGDLLIIYS